MKKGFRLIGSVILSITVLCCFIYFSSCKKETDITAVVVVKYLTDTTKIVPGAMVKIYIDKTKLQNQSNLTIDTVRGITDSNGEFQAEYRLEAILDIFAEKNNLKGQTIIRLKPGKTIKQTVYIH